ncbi:hypothetical protein [Stenotrophomonas phage CM2]
MVGAGQVGGVARRRFQVDDLALDALTAGADGGTRGGGDRGTEGVDAVRFQRLPDRIIRQGAQAVFDGIAQPGDVRTDCFLWGSCQSP